MQYFDETPNERMTSNFGLVSEQCEKKDHIYTLKDFLRSELIAWLGVREGRREDGVGGAEARLSTARM